MKKEKGASGFQDWRVWEGKVLGTPKEIQAALKALGRQPRSSRELENFILEARNKKFLEEMGPRSEWEENVDDF